MRTKQGKKNSEIFEKFVMWLQFSNIYLRNNIANYHIHEKHASNIPSYLVSNLFKSDFALYEIIFLN